MFPMAYVREDQTGIGVSEKCGVWTQKLRSTREDNSESIASGIPRTPRTCRQTHLKSPAKKKKT